MKIKIILLTILFCHSCSSHNAQISKNAQSQAISDRINQSQENNSKLFKELDD